MTEANAKVKLDKNRNFQGRKNAKLRLKKNGNQRQFSNKSGDLDDDTYLHDEQVNGTSQERKHQRIIKTMAKKYKVPASAAQGSGQADDGGMGMM